MKTIWSIVLVAAVAVGSLWISIDAIQTHLLEASEQEKTLAELLVQQQMKEQLAAAAQQVAQAVEDENLVIEQAEVTIKDPVIEPAVEPEVESEVEQTLAQETLETQDLGASEVEQGATTEPTYLAPLDVSEIEDVEGYLIANYFLNGYDYAEAETDPTLKAQKELACAMEAYAVDTIDELTGLSNVMSSMELTQAQEIYNAMVAGKAEFQEAYGYLEQDATFGPIYSAIVNYFDQAIALAALAVSLLEQVKASTNALLALSTLLKAVDAQLMPQIDEVLNAVFEMKELTNAVYLQGTDGVILTKTDAQVLVTQLEGLFLTW